MCDTTISNNDGPPTATVTTTLVTMKPKGKDKLQQKEHVDNFSARTLSSPHREKQGRIRWFGNAYIYLLVAFTI